jgi:hypothetical protein
LGGRRGRGREGRGREGRGILSTSAQMGVGCVEEERASGGRYKGVVREGSNTVGGV